MNILFLKKHLFLLTTLFLTQLAIAQSPPPSHGSGGNGNGQEVPAIFKISGTVIDSLAGVPMEYVPVSLLRGGQLVNGNLTDANGKFELANLKPGNYNLKVEFIGFKVKTIPLELSFKGGSTEKNIGTISLSTSSIEMQEVVVQGQKSYMASTIDKKVYRTDQLMSTVSGTATEVLNNVPSVSVDTDGKPSLRGQENVTILIDGRPSGLTGSNLSNLPASNIVAIEVITNPSAKFDPDGTAGIINIIMKKNASLGLNGQATLGTTLNTGAEGPVRNGYNGNLQLNYGKGKFNLSSNYSFRDDTRNSFGRSYRTLFNDSTTRNLQQLSSEINKNRNHTAKIAADYYLNKSNTLSASVAVNKSDGTGDKQTDYITLDSDNTPTYKNIRYTDENKDNLGYDLNLNYKREMGSPRHYLSLDMFRSRSQNKDTYLYEQYQADPESSTHLSETPFLQQTDSSRTNLTTYSFQADYSHPFGEQTLLEVGAKAILRENDNDYRSYLLDSVTNQYYLNTFVANRFIFNDKTLALYTTYGSKVGNFGYKIGLRAEQYLSTGKQEVNNQTFKNDYFNLFPSASLSYELNQKQQIQLSYSRRINRPQPSALNPFNDVTDPLNLRYGNPELQPERIHSIDLGHSVRFGKDNYTLTSSLYYRLITNSMVRILSYSGDTLSVQLQNAGRSRNYGGEIALNASPVKWWNFSLSANIFRNELDMSNLDASLNNARWMGLIKLLSTWKFPKGFDLQLSSWLNTPRNTPQGQVGYMGTTDISVRKKFGKTGNWNLAFNANDIFNIMQFKINAQGTDFTQSFLRKRQTRTFSLNATWRFGKTDNNAKKRKPDSSRPNSGGDMPDIGF